MTTPKAKLAGLALIAALCGGFALGLAPPAWAGMDEGMAAYVRLDYATAVREWRPFAEQGNASAQYNLGLMYDKGEGVPQDDAEAVKWYRKAAEQGNAMGQNNLGAMYANGRGVPQDYAKAMHWYRRTAEQGNPTGQFNVGLMYKQGRSVPQDYAEAIRWYRKAVEQGDGGAQSSLGVMYANGQGVPQDYVQALMWFTLGVSRLLPGEECDGAVHNRDMAVQEMTPAQIAEARKLAREWRPKKQGDAAIVEAAALTSAFPCK